MVLLGLGYHWIEGIGPKIKALRPNSQADGRVRVVFEREAREFQSFHIFVFQLRHSRISLAFPILSQEK